MGDPSEKDTERKLSHVSKMKEAIKSSPLVSLGDWRDVLSVEENLRRRLERIRKGKS